MHSPYVLALDSYCGPSSNNDPMSLAIKQSAKAFGHTHPNPPVGAVLERDGQILSQGHTQPNRGSHAEFVAIDKCTDPQGATLFVTLEPCCHYGANPPCTEIILQSKIKKVVIGSSDPNPKVNGKGARVLKSAGVEVEWVRGGEDRLKIQALFEPFFKRIGQGKPYILAKMATSRDGMISAGPNVQTKITGKQSQILTHGLRYFSDAIYTSKRTLDVDHPQLNVRCFGEGERSQKPVIARSLTAEYGEGQTNYLTAMLECGARMFNGYLKALMIDEFWHFTNPNFELPNGYPMTNERGYEILSSQYQIIEGPKNISPSTDVLRVYKRRNCETIKTN